MYEMIRTLDEKRVTPTREMTLILAKCCNCQKESIVTKQNFDRANLQQRKHCAECHGEDFHHMTNTRIWRIWLHMVSRATKRNDTDFKRYGAIGRGVSESWLRFSNFYADMHATYADNLTLDRIDNTQGYSKENCRWVTNAVQQGNKSNNRQLVYMGVKMHLGEFCRVANVSRGAITPRLNKGMSPEEALADYRASKYPKNRKSRMSTTL